MCNMINIVKSTGMGIYCHLTHEAAGTVSEMCHLHLSQCNTPASLVSLEKSMLGKPEEILLISRDGVFFLL